MSETPSTRIAVLFTDVVGSTRLWAEHHDAMADDLARHDAMLHDAIAEHRGHVFTAAGDSFAASFPESGDAVDAAVAAQCALASAMWKVPGGITIRTAVHVGPVIERGGTYFGPTLNVAARVMAAGHGGQVLITEAAATDVTIETIELGAHRLRDIDEPVRLRQVVATGLHDEFPPLATLDTSRSTLPQYRSSFVGRQNDIRRVRTLLTEHRLVTLTGVGGVGKTRLAVEVAAAEQAHFPGGVCFVDLAPVTEPDGILLAVATGIGLSVGRHDEMRDEIERFLASRSVLLVVDNCEHVLDDAAEMIDGLLTRSQSVRVLATTREALEIEGEETFRVASLDPNDAGLRLFVERATAANDQFDLTDGSHDSVVELCRHLDGMPLALELAASRSRSFAPAELLTRLDDRFTLLRGGRRRGALQRQRTLEAAIDWSHDLLGEQEQSFFRRLGVFVGVFMFDVVPTVTDFRTGLALELLDGLVSKSLVVPVPIDAAQTGYQLLESMQAYARARLADAGETEATASRHEEAYFDYCTSATPTEYAFCRAYRAQTADLWTAADHAVEHGRPERTARILAAGTLAHEGSANGAENLARTSELMLTHGDKLDASTRTLLAGVIANAQMNAGLFGKADQTVTLSKAFSSQASPDDRVHLDALEIVILTAIDPLAVPDRFDTLFAGMDDRANLYASSGGLRSAAYTAERRYGEAVEASLDQFRPLREFPSDKACAFSLWMSHLASRPPAPEMVEYGRSLTLDDTTYAVSCHVAATMCSGDEWPDVACALVDIGDRLLSGRCPLEEAELLVAYARIAQLMGDERTARHLADVVGPRTPWTVSVLAEIMGTLDGWPESQWPQRRVEMVLARTHPNRIADFRDDGPQVLAAEMGRWRT